MTQLGQIERGIDIGYKDHTKYGWHACLDCGKERWVKLDKGKPRALRCRSCAATKFLPHPAGSDAPRWAGGKTKHSSGYVLVYVAPTDFFSEMADHHHYVFEHRLVMAKHLGRCLHIWELIHHKNHIRDDNRFENLQLVSDIGHRQITILENKIVKLEKQVAEQAKRLTLLEAENVLIRQGECGHRLGLACSKVERWELGRGKVIDEVQPIDIPLRGIGRM